MDTLKSTIKFINANVYNTEDMMNIPTSLTYVKKSAPVAVAA